MPDTVDAIVWNKRTHRLSRITPPPAEKYAKPYDQQAVSVLVARLTLKVWSPAHQRRLRCVSKGVRLGSR